MKDYFNFVRRNSLSISITVLDGNVFPVKSILYVTGSYVKFVIHSPRGDNPVFVLPYSSIVFVKQLGEEATK